MIPSRRLGGEVFENAVRYRVVACRKRLRISRTIPRTQIHINLEERSQKLDLLSTADQDRLISERAGEQEEAESP